MYERMNSYLFVLVYVPVCVYARVNGYVHLQEIKMRMHARLQTCMCMCMQRNRTECNGMSCKGTSCKGMSCKVLKVGD